MSKNQTLSSDTQTFNGWGTNFIGSGQFVWQSLEMPTEEVVAPKPTTTQVNYGAKYKKNKVQQVPYASDYTKDTKRTFLGIDYDISDPNSVYKLLANINKYLGVDHLKLDSMWGERSELAFRDIESVKAYYDDKRSKLKGPEILTPDRDYFIKKLNNKTYGTTAGDNGGYYQEWDPTTGTYKTRDANERGAISINNLLYDLDDNAAEAQRILGLEQTGIWTDEDLHNQETMFSRMQEDWNKANQTKWQDDFNSNNAVIGEDGIDYSGKWMRDAADKYKSDFEARQWENIYNGARTDAFEGPYAVIKTNSQRAANEDINWDIFGTQIENELLTRYGIEFDKNNSTKQPSFNRTNLTPDQISEILNAPENIKYARAISNLQSLLKYIASKDALNPYAVEMLNKILDNTLLGAVNNINRYLLNKDKNQSNFAQGVKVALYNAKEDHLKEIGWKASDENIANLVGIAVDAIPDLAMAIGTVGTGTAASISLKQAAKEAAITAAKLAMQRAGGALSKESIKIIALDAAKLYLKQSGKTIAKLMVSTGAKEYAYWAPRGTVVNAGQLSLYGDVDWNQALTEGNNLGMTAAVLGGIARGASLPFGISSSMGSKFSNIYQKGLNKIYLTFPTLTETIGPRITSAGNLIGSAGKWAGNTVYQAGKYTLLHPIESYVGFPLVLQVSDKLYGVDRTAPKDGWNFNWREGLSDATTMILTPWGSSLGRKIVGTPTQSFIDSKFGRTVGDYTRNSLTNAGMRYNLGNHIIGNIATGTLYGLQNGIVGFGIGASGIGEQLRTGNEGIDFATLSLLYGGLQAAPNGGVRFIRNVKLATGGNLHPVEGFVNIIYNIKTHPLEFFKSNPKFEDNYTQVYHLSEAAREHTLNTGSNVGGGGRNAYSMSTPEDAGLVAMSKHYDKLKPGDLVGAEGGIVIKKGYVDQPLAPESSILEILHVTANKNNKFKGDRDRQAAGSREVLVNSPGEKIYSPRELMEEGFTEVIGSDKKPRTYTENPESLLDIYLTDGRGDFRLLGDYYYNSAGQRIVGIFRNPKTGLYKIFLKDPSGIGSVTHLGKGNKNNSEDGRIKKAVNDAKKAVGKDAKMSMGDIADSDVPSTQWFKSVTIGSPLEFDLFINGYVLSNPNKSHVQGSMKGLIGSLFGFGGSRIVGQVSSAANLSRSYYREHNLKGKVTELHSRANLLELAALHYTTKYNTFWKKLIHPFEHASAVYNLYNQLNGVKSDIAKKDGTFLQQRQDNLNGRKAKIAELLEIMGMVRTDNSVEGYQLKKSEHQQKRQEKLEKIHQLAKDNSDKIFELYLTSRDFSSFYSPGKRKPTITLPSLVLLALKAGFIRQSYFDALPSDILRYIKGKYSKMTYYKLGGKLTNNFGIKQIGL